MPSKPSNHHFLSGHALLIGVGGDLPCTKKDVVELHKILVDPDRCAYPTQNVIVLIEENATAAKICDALERLSEAVKNEQEGATVIVYFSGHGLKHETGEGNRYYLVTSDCDRRDRRDPKKVAQSCLGGDEFSGWLEKIPAKRLLLLLDCCHAGGIELPKAGNNQLYRAPMPFDVAKGLGNKKGRVIVASSRADEISVGLDPCSAFTYSLLEAFCGEGASQKDGFVRAADLALYTREHVPGKTNGQQHPILDFVSADNFEVAYYSGGSATVKEWPLPPFVPPLVNPGIPEHGPTEMPPGVKTLQLILKLIIKWSPLWIAIVLAILLFPTIRVALFGLPDQEQMVKDAATEYDKGFCDEERCLQAIAKAKKVINRYQYSAQSEENALAGVTPFPVGAVDHSVAKQVFKNGSLNSVAYSWWIVGGANEKLGRFCDAAEAYEAAARFPHARTWDPQWWPLQGWSPWGWFWSPPDDAQSRIGFAAQHCNPAQGGKP